LIKSIVERAQESARLGNMSPFTYRIEGERGLQLRVSSGGTASWSFGYGVKGTSAVQRYGLGRYPDVAVKNGQGCRQQVARHRRHRPAVITGHQARPRRSAVWPAPGRRQASRKAHKIGLCCNIGRFGREVKTKGQLPAK
jgi:hypothetical protein